jgi:hypothetical protein
MMRLISGYRAYTTHAVVPARYSGQHATSSTGIYDLFCKLDVQRVVSHVLYHMCLLEACCVSLLTIIMGDGSCFPKKLGEVCCRREVDAEVDVSPALVLFALTPFAFGAHLLLSPFTSLTRSTYRGAPAHFDGKNHSLRHRVPVPL